MLGNANMFLIVRRHVKYSKMCQVVRHVKMCEGVTTRECQGVPGNVRFPSKASCEGMSAKS